MIWRWNSSSSLKKNWTTLSGVPPQFHLIRTRLRVVTRGGSHICVIYYEVLLGSIFVEFYAKYEAEIGLCNNSGVPRRVCNALV